MKNNIALFGFGKTNEALLKSENKTFDVFDDRYEKPTSDEMGNNFYPSSFYEKLKESYDTQIITPGIPPHNDLVKNATNLISDFDYYKEKFAFSIWISGTNGKTTTTQMLSHLFGDEISQMGSNIGNPIANMDKNKKIWLLEVSSFSAFYTNTIAPNIYLLLPIKNDHLTWHGDFEHYENAKLKPLKNMTPKDVAILPSVYKNVKTKAYVIYYNDSYDLAKQMDIDINALNIQKPFDLNALLALSAQKILFDKIDMKKINTFEVDKHKLQKITDRKDRIWINDSKATNISASIEAIKSYEKYPIHLILGGDAKGVSLREIIEFINKKDIFVYAIGECENEIQNLCKEFNISYFGCKTLQNAIDEIDKNLKNNQIAMLSPACASLDQFSSYKQRGDEFISKVNSL